MKNAVRKRRTQWFNSRDILIAKKTDSEEFKSIIAKERLKAETDKTPDKFIENLPEIMKKFDKHGSDYPEHDKRDFINQTSGCMKDSPISPGEQGNIVA